MTGGRSIIREVAVIIGVMAALALAAFGLLRLLAPKDEPSAAPPDIAKNLDEGLGSLMRDQIRATQEVVDEPLVARDFAVITQRLRDAESADRDAESAEHRGAEAPAVKGPRLTVIVLRSPEINAFTLPGDTVCVNTGLIRELRSAEEMAGVLGHEFSHAVNRDPLTLLARRIGTAVLLSARAGGQGGAMLSTMAQTMIDMGYGREAEDRADDFSVRLLARAGIAPGSFADALERIRDSDLREPGLLKYLDPHSPIDQRIARARDLARGQPVKTRPLGVDWAALVEALPGR